MFSATSPVRVRGVGDLPVVFVRWRKGVNASGRVSGGFRVSPHELSDYLLSLRGSIPRPHIVWWQRRGGTRGVECSTC